MAPVQSRQVLVWSLPALAFLLSLLWYRRKRSAALRSDPGGTPKHLTSKALEPVLSNNIQSMCDAKTEIELDNSSAVQISTDNCGELLVLPEKPPTEDTISVPLKSAADKIDKVDEFTSDTPSDAENCSTRESVFLTASNTYMEEDIIEEVKAVVEEEVEVLTETVLAEEQIHSENSDQQSVLVEDNVLDDFIADTKAKFMETTSAINEKIEASLKEVDTMARKSSSESCTQGNGSSIKEEDVPKKFAKVEENVAAVEDKLSALQLGEVASEPLSNAENVSRNSSIATATETHRTERDSANHSPADVMLASPSISSCSDAHSEGSSDSGKGCSDVATPPSRTPASGSSLAGDSTLPSIYEFVMPQHLVGRLIGRHGTFVHQIKAETNASIIVKRHPDTNALKICAIEGTQADIEGALNMIRQKFPLKKYPDVTLEQVCFVPPVPVFAVLPDYMQLQLIEDVNNDVILSSLVTPGHFFLQQSTHPTFPALNTLNVCMNMCYSDSLAPPLPVPPAPGIICAAPTVGGWYRAQAVTVDPDTETCTIKFVDYGGYLTVDYSVLRQIRSDFMTLPFQAAECYLANICPAGGIDAEWTKEAIAGMEELTQGQVLQAQVGGYAENGLPVVYLYAMHNSEVILVNQELVNRGLAENVEPVEA